MSWIEKTLEIGELCTNTMIHPVKLPLTLVPLNVNPVIFAAMVFGKNAVLVFMEMPTVQQRTRVVVNALGVTIAKWEPLYLYHVVHPMCFAPFKVKPHAKSITGIILFHITTLLPTTPIRTNINAN